LYARAGHSVYISARYGAPEKIHGKTPHKRTEGGRIAAAQNGRVGV